MRENNQDTVYYYDGNNLLAKKDPTGTYYYHPDHLGSTTLVTDKSKNIVEETSYLPFGAVFSGGNDRYTYTGQELDKTGLMYYGARYYSPDLRHFTQADTILPDIYDPQQLNRYSYVRNNPYKYVDPSGNIIGLIIAVVVIAIVVSVAYSIYSQTRGEATLSDVDWGDVGKAAAAGAAGGFAAAAAGLVGSFMGAASALIIGGFAGFVAHQATSNLMYDQPITTDIYESAVSGAESGGAAYLAVETLGLAAAPLVSKVKSPNVRVEQLKVGKNQHTQFGDGKIIGRVSKEGTPTAIIHEEYGGFKINYIDHPRGPGRMEVRTILDDLTKNPK